MIDLDRVSAWLGESVALEGTATTGSSSTTLFVRVGAVAAVLQHPPEGPTLPTAHDLARQDRFLRAVAASGRRVPVPRVLEFCADLGVAGMPFLITERADGVCLLGDRTHQVDGAPLAIDAIDVMVNLHAIDWRALGLTTAPGSYVERQIIRWHDQLTRTPTATRLGDLLALKEWLLAHRPRTEERVIVHGDFGFHNLLVVRDRVTAVLDWELATIGDPLVDLTGFAKSWGEGALSPNPANDVVARAAGALTRDQLIAEYEARSGRGFSEHRAYYEALSMWKSIGIFEGIHARSGGTRFVDEVPELVARLRQLIGQG
ncbi:MAG TPA: phosphotransferase family protein [Acidimicrobiales bacterium]|nr:phosphotransferase family protein [Acidimicrobiales bacterium]